MRRYMRYLGTSTQVRSIMSLTHSLPLHHTHNRSPDDLSVGHWMKEMSIDSWTTRNEESGFNYYT